MILPYFLRLFCLCLTSFLLIHSAMGLAVWLAAPSAIRKAEAMRPRVAARFLLFLRALPALLAAFVVLVLGVPSYMWLEPKATQETVSVACCVAALIGTSVWCLSIARAARAALRSGRYARQCQLVGREIFSESRSSAVTLLEVEAPVVALAGVLRPRILISRSVLRVLTPDQLDAALRHENAHRTSCDNLKRFLILLAPEIFPLSCGMAALECAWARFSEWAADDEATGGDERESLFLAAALINVARLGTAPQPSLAIAPLIAGDLGLSTRVDRLLQGNAQSTASLWQRTGILGCALTLLAVALASAMEWPAILRTAHLLLERLVG